MKQVIFLGVFIFTFLCGQSLVKAQESSAWDDKKADQLLEAHNWIGLKQLLPALSDEKATVESMDWIEKKIHAGAGFL